uniref:ATPase n=1 Tax=Prevotella sp. GTC17259 TaxID=3236795 RepID=A0AB33J6M9_9BACT
MMKLIAESGSSHTSWVLIENGKIVEQQRSDGLNPYFQNRREISRSIRLGLPEEFFHKKIQHIYFYGAGCDTEIRKNTVKASLISQFRTPVTVESNLVAAARGLCQDSPGIACILDTGSNSCLYNGKQIVSSVKTCGFILGDEGSGSAIGKSFLSDVMKNLAPKELVNAFYLENNTNADEVMHAVYNEPRPNYYLAKVALFLTPYTSNEYVHKLITKNFRCFFNRNVSQFPYHDYPISFIGNVAHTYSGFLLEVCDEFGITPTTIVESSINGLITYHGKNILTP